MFNSRISLIVALWGLVALVAPAMAQVAIDNGGPGATFCQTCAGGQASPVTVTIAGTVNATSNPAMACAIMFDSAGKTVTSVQWHATDTFSQISSAVSTGTNASIEWWGGKITIGATLGTGTVIVSWSGGNSRVSINCVSWSGVNQTTPFAGGTNAITAVNQTTQSLTPTSSAGDMVAAAFFDDTSFSSTVSVNQTAISTSTAGAVNGSTQGASGSTLTVTMDTTCCRIDGAGMAIKAAGAGATVNKMTLIGVGP